ncbi:hypothetical protein [Methylobacterium nigriterrae]|uniref:hypothetical protein n=1 Tax=Methylobacterium nigriterrae TaxID=3127512 RepID=UPI003013414B
MRALRVCALTAFLFSLTAIGSALAEPDGHLTVHAPLYREQIRNTQHVRARSDLRVTSQPVWTAHPDQADLKNELTEQSQ